MVRIEEWIASSDTAAMKQFRQAVHVILKSISSSAILKQSMLLKGGILLALEYDGNRYTKDIDFSTEKKLEDFDPSIVIGELEKNLPMATQSLPYGLDCEMQRYKIEPPGDGKNFHTLKANIGYARYGTKSHERLKKGMCPAIVSIDFSYNEPICSSSEVVFSQEDSIYAYDLVDLVAEKYRAILQQEERMRYRRQDAYDIYCLLEKRFVGLEDHKDKILESIKIKAASRNITAKKTSMLDANIVIRSKKEYYTLSDEIKGELPSFGKVYKAARIFYESLPW